MTPTNYLRFVWRVEDIDCDPAHRATMGRRLRVLQQFWASPDGASASVFPAPGTGAGEWRDVPLEEQE